MLGITRVRAGVLAPEVARLEEGKRSARRPGPALLLAVFFGSLYLLTMGGHLDSPDEELMFQATRSLVERRSLDVGDAASPERLAFPGTDGRTYAPYGPVSSVLSVPFYGVGVAAATLAPPRYAEYLERLAVSLRDVVVSTALCLLFFATARLLGYLERTSLLLTVAFGGATLIWPYAKYTWSEPVTALFLLLSVYAAMRAVRERSEHSPLWSVLSGIAVGLAIGSKVSTAVVVPGLLAYLGLRHRRIALPFAAALVMPALGVAAVDVMRFGNPLDTGYHLDGLIDLTRPVGIAGLLISPSKSIFLYAPIMVLGLIGLTRLPRAESMLFVFIVLSHVLLYGSLAIWAGDAAWGPRYLVPVVAFLVLPAGAVLQDHMRAFAALVAAGVVINLGAVLLDQRVYYIYLLGAGQRDSARVEALRWDPLFSPPLLHWRLLGGRYVRSVRNLSAPAALESGAYQSDFQLTDGFPAWTSGDAVVHVSQPAHMLLRYRDSRPPGVGDSDVQVVINGVRAALTPVRDEADNFWDATFDVPGRATLDVRSTTFVPARDAPPSVDVRQLGIQVLGMTANGEPVRMANFPPMPVSDAQPWTFELSTWFWAPSTHLADVWEWYLWLSGLPRALVLLALVPAAGLAWSTRALRQELLSNR